MENKDALSDACNMEISIRPEPHLEVSQDLELLAQEIAEAAVEEERRSSTSSSPTPSQFHMPDFSSDEMLEADNLTDTEKPGSAKAEVGLQEQEEGTVPDNVSKKKRDRGRSQSPVDEASWEIVDSVDELSVSRDEDEDTVTSPAQNHCIVRKFLGSHDLWQKLKDLGMVCDICNDMNSSDNQSEDVSGFPGLPNSANDLTVSCSESMVICDMPQEDEEQPAVEEGQCPLPLRNIPDNPLLPSWKGRVAGATVVVELERLGGLLIASVRVNHTDLLSALASLQQLAASAGLVSYADVDIQSILARAA
ncbi:uncharacterized protein LOC135216711 [Macrobrachium nipponense]|uniref:uncharacterized protein LOC135216711 n=1 Tax=Macrobrachium nipponense TaxID=159736 RepID=UPI0030C83F77